MADRTTLPVTRRGCLNEDHRRRRGRTFGRSGSKLAVSKRLCSTSRPAAVLGREDIGAIEVGRLADIVAVPGNPLEDPMLMGQMAFVMKGGEVVRNMP